MDRKAARGASQRFAHDLIAGNRAEEVVAEALRGRASVLLGFNDDWRGDFAMLMDGWPYVFEVKDESNQDTGNVCIETWQGDPPRWSGIHMTHAQVQVHLLPRGKAVAFEVVSMRQYIAEMRLASYPLSGADNNALGVLVPVADIAKHVHWCAHCDLERLGEYSQLWPGAVRNETR